MCVQNICACTIVSIMRSVRRNRHTREVNCQNSISKILQPLILLLRQWNTLIHQRHLARDTQWVQHEEEVVPQPCKDGGDVPIECEDKVSVSHDFGERPRDEHGAVEERVGGHAGELVADAPDEDDAGDDLEECGRDWCAYDT